MGEEHLDTVMRYEDDMFGTEAWSRASYRDELRDRLTRRYYVVLDEVDEVIAWGGIRLLRDEAEVLTVGVVPTARSQGIGSMLVETLIADVRARGARDVFLEVRVDNAAAKSLYLKNGFENMGIRRGYYDGGRVDAITMHRRLESHASGVSAGGAR